LKIVFSLKNARKLIFIYPLEHWGYKNGIGNKGNDIYKPRAIKVQLWLSADRPLRRCPVWKDPAHFVKVQLLRNGIAGLYRFDTTNRDSVLF